jgi:predicted Zn-dependent protease
MKPAYRKQLLHLLLLLALGSGLVSPPSSAANEYNLPDLGSSTSSLISRQKEYEIGEAWMMMYRSRVPAVEDPVMQLYLEQLLDELVQFSELENKELNLVLVNNDSMNAFAVPGGVIGIHSGLFLHADTEAQLASVLTHELAHQSQRHWVRTMEKARQNLIPTMAGLLASLILIATSHGEAGLAAMHSTQAANMESMLRYTRRNETDADNIGIKTLEKAGYDPHAAVEMFENMMRTTRFMGQRPPEFLISHPLTEKRIANARNRAERSPLKVFKNNPDYHLMQARARLHHAERPQYTVKSFRSEIELETGNLLANRYGLALALTASHQYQDAEKIILPLSREKPDNIYFIQALAELYYHQARYSEATEEVKRLLGIAPNYYPAELLAAQILNRQLRFSEAEVILEQLVRSRPKDPTIWYELAENRGLGGNIAGVHVARAEFFLLNGGFEQARRHLNWALEMQKDNFVESSRIKQRLTEVTRLEEIIENL